jgi:hypothetical protein
MDPDPPAPFNGSDAPDKEKMEQVCLLIPNSAYQ